MSALSSQMTAPTMAEECLPLMAVSWVAIKLKTTAERWAKVNVSEQTYWYTQGCSSVGKSGPSNPASCRTVPRLLSECNRTLHRHNPDRR